MPKLSTTTLTAELIASLRPVPGKRLYKWDGGSSEAVQGLGIIVYPSGRKTFAFQYQRTVRPEGGEASVRTTRIVVGEYGSMTLQQARVKARALRVQIDNKNDPGAARDAKRAQRSVKSAFDDFEAEKRAHRSPRTATEYRRLLDLHVAPKIGHIPIGEVTKQDALRVKAGLRETPVQANRAMAVLSSFFQWATQQGEYPETLPNPVRGIKAYPEHAKQRYLNSDELQRIGAALALYETESQPKQPAYLRRAQADAVRFILLSGVRNAQARALRWSDLDFSLGVLRGTVKGHRSIPLGAAAIEFLRQLPRVSGSPWVFPGRTKDKALGTLTQVWEDIRTRAKVEDTTIHTLRHTFAAFGASGGISLPALGAVLGHRDAKTTARYAHIADAARRATADQISAEISAAVNGTAPTVIPLNAKRALKKRA
jgi:integrase